MGKIRKNVICQLGLYLLKSFFFFFFNVCVCVRKTLPTAYKEFLVYSGRGPFIRIIQINLK